MLQFNSNHKLHGGASNQGLLSTVRMPLLWQIPVQCRACDHTWRAPGLSPETAESMYGPDPKEQDKLTKCT